MLDTEVEVCRYTQMQCIQPKSRYSGYRESCFRPVRLQIQWIHPVSGRVPDTVDTYLTSRVEFKLLSRPMSDDEQVRS